MENIEALKSIARKVSRARVGGELEWSLSLYDDPPKAGDIMYLVKVWPDNQRYYYEVRQEPSCTNMDRLEIDYGWMGYSYGYDEWALGRVMVTGTEIDWVRIPWGHNNYQYGQKLFARLSRRPVD
jgi:hypothetical protein